MRNSGLTLVIPCLNEKITIGRAVELSLTAIAESKLPGEVIVADNGSTDGSQLIATAAGARVVEVRMRGYGAALHHGILAAKYRWVVFGDADLSYPLEKANLLIAPLAAGQADFVLGTRLGGTIEPGAMPFLNRHLGTPILSWLIRRLYHLPTSDCNSGMRALDREQYEDLALMCPGMEYASEMIIRVAHRKLRYQEVPIPFRRDQRGRPPHLSRWRDGWRHLRFIVGNASSKILIALPLLMSAPLFILALLISFQQSWDPAAEIHYHTAFVALAIAAPLLMFVISSVLIKSALHSSGQVESTFIHFVQEMGEKNYPIRASLLFFALMFIELIYLFYRWKMQGFGGLSEISSVIRLMVFTIIATSMFTLDLGLGILKLIPYSVNPRHQKKDI